MGQGFAAPSGRRQACPEGGAAARWVHQNQLWALQVWRGGLEAESFKQKQNRTSSLTELANGILFPP